VDENERGHNAKLLRAAPITSAVGRVQVGSVPSRQSVPSRRDDGIPVASDLTRSRPCSDRTRSAPSRVVSAPRRAESGSATIALGYQRCLAGPSQWRRSAGGFRRPNCADRLSRRPPDGESPGRPLSAPASSVARPGRSRVPAPAFPSRRPATPTAAFAAAASAGGVGTSRP
jgi:hypothetical protein